MTIASGCAVITNDVVTSNLNVVTSFGHVIVAITTKVRVAEGSSSHVTQPKSSALLAIKNSRYVWIWRKLEIRFSASRGMQLHVFQVNAKCSLNFLVPRKIIVWNFHFSSRSFVQGATRSSRGTFVVCANTWQEQMTSLIIVKNVAFAGTFNETRSYYGAWGSTWNKNQFTCMIIAALIVLDLFLMVWWISDEMF